jgi:hypothetical protein
MEAAGGPEGSDMATREMSDFIQHLRRAQRDGVGLTDGQLLGDYLSRSDEAALAALVHRHGPMGWGVCRRLLQNYPDAEDAFQATFLVLVRRAASIASREALANWLYGVAHMARSSAPSLKECAERRNLSRKRRRNYSSSPVSSCRSRRSTRQRAMYTAFSLMPSSPATSVAGRPRATCSPQAFQVVGRNRSA